ncbi:MAG: purine phosphorylase [Mahellales bacterium]|jgi:adenosylhomocysteine nucleosidase
MIYITTAMQWEAKPLISHWGLKKDLEVSVYRVYKNRNMVLAITGVGVIPAAVGATYMLTQYKARPGDMFINIGICGARDKHIDRGRAVLCHKIIHHDTKKCYYPDMLFKHPFSEGVLETFSRPVTRTMYRSVEGDVVDMEGAGAYQAAERFLDHGSIHCIKIVSDYLQGDRLEGGEVARLVEENVPVINKWIQGIKGLMPSPALIFTKEEEECMDRVCQNLRLTTTMKHHLRHLAEQYTIRRQGLVDVLKPFGDIECTSKDEVKYYFGQLKERLMEY